MPLIFDSNIAATPSEEATVGPLSLLVSSAPWQRDVGASTDASHASHQLQKPSTPCSSAPLSQMQAANPATPSLDLVQYAVGSTLLPQNIAEMVTNLSIVARVSLRATAFFLEVILEATRTSTGLGIGLTRRALISAIGAARTMHALTEENDLLRIAGPSPSAGNPFTAILDKYTALGIYVVHHSLTMAELFAMSGITLAQDSVKAGALLAEESVRIIDGIFGSNESSRALSSFIQLCRQEFSPDKCTTTGGGLRSMAAYTRCITTFAVVQAATHRRSAKQHRMRVLYDCTVLGEAETASWRALLLGPGSFKAAAQGNAGPVGGNTCELSSSQGTLPRALSDTRSLLNADSRLSRSFVGDDPSIFDGPVGAELDEASLLSGSGDALAESRSIMQGLDFYCGEDDEGVAPRESRPPHVQVSHLSAEEDLPPTLRKKLAHFDDDELSRGVVIDEQKLDASEPRQIKQVVRKRRGHDTVQTVWEIVTETTEITETIEEETIPFAEDDPAQGFNAEPEESPSRGKGLLRIIKPRMPFGLLNGNASPPRRRQDRDITHTKSERHEDVQLEDGRIEELDADEQEWTEISQTVERRRHEDAVDDQDSRHASLPMAVNGRTQASSSGDLQDAGTRVPLASKQGMRVVLKRVRRKLKTKTTKVVSREVAVSESREDSPTSEGGGGTAGIEETASGQTTPQRNGWAKRLAVPTASPHKSVVNNVKSSLSPRSSQTPLRANPHLLNIPTRESSALTAKPPASQAAFPGEDGIASLSKGRKAASQASKKRRSRNLSHASIRSSTSRQHTHVSAGKHGPDPEQPAFPQKPLVVNLQHFMRYASACYGQHFMNIFGIGDPSQFRNTREAHASELAFADHVGIGFEDVLLSSFTEDSSVPFHSKRLTPIVNFVAVDKEYKSVVLACRGTVGLSDVLVDLTGEYVPAKFECGEGYVHGGIYGSAARLVSAKGTVMSVLKKTLEEYPDFGLVTVGHSLGAGVSAILALLLGCPTQAMQDYDLSRSARGEHGRRPVPYVTSPNSGLPPGRPIHAFCYGPPALLDAELAKSISGLITTVVYNFDMVPSVCIGTVRDFRDIAEVLEEGTGESTTEILARTIGFYQKKRKQAASNVDSDHLIQGRSADPVAGRHPSSPSVDDTACLDTALPHPTEVPEQERLQLADQAELTSGHTRNRATDVRYVDPRQMPFPLVDAKDEHRNGEAAPGPSSSHMPKDDEGDLEDWLWSLIKTMRAHAQSDKIYPPGRVYCLENFEVYVKAKPGPSAENGNSRGERTKHGESQQTKTKTSSAHRVILRACEDVVARFSEPIFCRTLFRDHFPTNYEFCLDLLLQAQGAPRDSH